MLYFAERARELGLSLSDEQQAQFERYAAELAAWNERFNLTTITEPAQVETHHFLDSLSALPVLAAAQAVGLTTLLASTARAIDVGSGPGLPGLALKLVWPGLQMTLLEGTGKKVTFLEHMIQVCQLTGIRAVHGRAEELAGHAPWREGFDLVLARAVGIARSGFTKVWTMISGLFPFAMASSFVATVMTTGRPPRLVSLRMSSPASSMYSTVLRFGIRLTSTEVITASISRPSALIFVGSKPVRLAVTIVRPLAGSMVRTTISLAPLL